ncbi:MAG: Iron-regulated ABC transporter ATPase [Microgenomates group bacterium GW2011_GWA2_46_7]|nr:MAG: Iron-regulated ABC transporter ATPase [Microgenomates group bacterium GW2011_GWA2_46_7]
MLKITNLTVTVLGKQVLSEMDLQIGVGEVHVLMGVNGSGKSSLAMTLMGDSRYQISDASKVQYLGQDLLKLSSDERARVGLYVSWQNPTAIPGVSVFNLCKASYGAMGNKIDKLIDFKKKLEELALTVGLTREHINRNVNEGFSGGERKRLELMQLLLLKPKLAILDEIDSGLDREGLKIVREIVSEIKEEGRSALIITHNEKLLEKMVITKIWKITN